MTQRLQVLIRTRPQNERETGLTGEGCSLQQRGAGGLQLAVEGRSYSFEFDDVLGNDGSQEEIFQRATRSPTPRQLSDIFTDSMIERL